MLFTVMMAFSSCDLLDPPSDDEEPGDVNPPAGDDNDPPSVNEPEEEEKEPEARTTITEDEFIAHNQFINFTLDYDIAKVATNASGETIRAEMSAIGWYDGTFSKLCTSYEETGALGETVHDEEETITLYEDGFAYELIENGDFYFRKSSGYSQYVPFVGDVIHAFAEELSELTYDEEKKAYTIAFEDSSISWDVHVDMAYLYFEDGVLAKIETVGRDNDSINGEDYTVDATSVMAFSDIETTEVDVPEYLEENRINYIIWLNHTEIDNFIITKTSTWKEEENSGVEITEIHRTSDAQKLIEDGEETLLAYSDGEWYDVKEQGGEYIGTDKDFFTYIYDDLYHICSIQDYYFDYSQYLEDEGAYYYKESSDVNEEWKFYFYRGELTRVYHLMGDKDSDYYEEVEIIVNNIGDTVIEVPEFTIPDAK